MPKEKFSMTQYLRLQRYLMELHLSGEACVFVDFSGHVDWVRIQVCSNKKEYDIHLYEQTIYLPEKNGNYVYENWKILADEIIEEIKQVVADREQKVAEHKEKLEADEREELARLTKKYNLES